METKNVKPEFIARQTCKPSGFLGQIIGMVMARQTSYENSKTLDLLNLEPEDEVLEVGFGHGETLYQASRRVRVGGLAGIDYSDAMLVRASNRNRDLIESGQLELRCGDSRELPFPCEHFDKAYSVHTIYFWPEPEEDLEEMHRVLRSGGRIVISYCTLVEQSSTDVYPHTVYRYPDTRAVETLLANIGFVSIQTETERNGKTFRHWITGEKP